jgi:two-component system, NtrC family, sensor kinase
MNKIESAHHSFVVLDNVPIGTFVINQEYRILFWNRCMEDWTGFPHHDIAGTNLDQLFPHFRQSRYYDRILGLFEGGPPTVFSSQLHSNLLALSFPDGRPRIHNITVTAMPTSDANVFNALFAVEDVTDLTNRVAAYIRAQTDLNQACTQMEVNVGHRTADLAQAVDKLQQEISDRKQAEKALAQANRELKTMQSQIIQSEKLASIGQLAAGVAHEMNTPVGFVGSNFQTLMSYMKKFLDLFAMYEHLHGEVEGGSKLDRLTVMEQIKQARTDMKIDFILEDIQELFEESSEGIKRVSHIIQNLRDFSRIDQAEALADFNLNEGIRTTLIVARNEIKYDADIVTHLGELPQIRCNSGQINQVFLTILVNAAQAIKFQESKTKGTITIKTHATEKEVLCDISDNGPGIPSDKLSKIFDPFFTTKPVGKGTGLGLSVAYDIIVNKHKGQLGVSSELGGGTTFTLRLPISRGDTDARDQREADHV